MAVEHDGQWPADVTQSAQDRARLDRLGAVGWRVFVTAADLYDPPRLLARVAAALADADVR